MSEGKALTSLGLRDGLENSRAHPANKVPGFSLSEVGSFRYNA